MATIKQGTFQQKTPKTTSSLSNQFWNPNANVRVKAQYIKFKPNSLPKGAKKPIRIFDAFRVTNTIKKKRFLSKFIHLSLKIVWAPGPKLLCISKSTKLSYSSQIRITFPAPPNPPTTSYNKVFHFISLIFYIKHFPQITKSFQWIT